MKTIFDDRMKKLEADITANDHEKNQIKRVSLNFQVAKDAVCDVIQSIELDYYFDQSIQIQYNKYYLPPFFAKVLFFKKCYQLETRKVYSTSEINKLYYEQELVNVQQFFITHSSFCQYYYAENTEDDWLLFTTLQSDYNPAIQEYLFPTCTNSSCLLVAYLLCNEQYGSLIHEELNMDSGKLPLQMDEKIEIDGSETDIVELALAIHAADFVRVHGKEASQEFLIERMRELFQQPLKNWKQLAAKIRNRKFSDLKFLDRLSKSLSKRNGGILMEKRLQRKLKNN